MEGSVSFLEIRDAAGAVLILREIEIFKQLTVDGLASSWQHYTCAGLDADDVRVFTLRDCTRPEAL